MKKTVLALLIAGASIGCASSKYLARVNDETITSKDLTDVFARMHGGHSKFLLGESEARQFLDIVIDQRLLIQEAGRLDLQNQPDIQKAVKEYEDRKAVEYLIRTELDEKAQPSPEEIRAAWQTKTTRLYRTRQIVVDTREEAVAAFQSLAAGGDFETLARQCSIAASRIYGGRLPLLGWGAMEPEWEEAVAKLEASEMSDVFQVPDGWEIVQVEEILPVGAPPFDQAAKRIEGILKKRKLDERRRDFSAFLWDKYHVQRGDIDLAPEGLHAAMQQKADEPIASWDGGKLTVKEFVKQIDWREFAALLPGRFRTEMEERLRQVVNDPLATLEARARGLGQAPEVAAAVRSYRDDLMERALYADFVLKNVKVADAEIESYYAARTNELTAPEKRRMAHIVVPSFEEAQEIRKRLDEGESFASLVKANSTDTSSVKQAGDLGWITKKEATGEFGKVFELAEGQVSEPLKSKFGWHLMKVEAITPEKPLSLDEAREPIRKVLTEEKQREARAAWVKQLRAAATIRISSSGIRSFVQSNAPKS
jgi:parvulin-like peptidyl-prolyl isomerase